MWSLLHLGADRDGEQARRSYQAGASSGMAVDEGERMGVPAAQGEDVMGQGGKIKLTLTIHQVQMLEADTSQHAITTESAADAVSWKAIERECRNALDYAARRATAKGARSLRALGGRDD